MSVCMSMRTKQPVPWSTHIWTTACSHSCTIQSASLALRSRRFCTQLDAAFETCIRRVGSTSVRSCNHNSSSETHTQITDIKPDNIMVDWSLKEVGIMRVERAMLCDTDGAGHLLPTQTFRGTVGTVLWRGPECHTGEGICSSSDVFSFGLTVSTQYVPSTSLTHQ